MSFENVFQLINRTAFLNKTREREREIKNERLVERGRKRDAGAEWLHEKKENRTERTVLTCRTCFHP